MRKGTKRTKSKIIRSGLKSYFANFAFDQAAGLAGGRFT